MHLLVTVGTTKFVDLIDIVLNNLVDLTRVYDTVTIQTGLMELNDDYEYIPNLKIFDFIDHLDINQYDVILCHCGTGSILEGLSNNKKVVAIVNKTLKDDHQSETAEVFENYIFIKNKSNVIPFLLQKRFPKRKQFNIKKQNSFLKDLMKN